jgi:uncharacterized repeat protein (TIGR03803 family)
MQHRFAIDIRQFKRPARTATILAAFGITSLLAFEVQAAKEPLELLHQFTSATDGFGSASALQHGPDDRFYGVSSTGGRFNSGTVYAVDKHGAFSVLHAFNWGTEGDEPSRRLVVANDGLLYGVLSSAAKGCGAIFRLSPSGDAFKVMYSLSGPTDGCHSFGGLVQGADGTFYGTTSTGGKNEWGTVFRWHPLKGFKTLHHFTHANGDGGYPLHGATLSADGKTVHGVTWRGGSEDGGVLFKVRTDGTGYQVIQSLTEATGTAPSGELLLAKDGNFYGTANSGGAHHHGSIYRLTPAGEASAIYSFESFSAVGSAPAGQLTDGGSGLLYGTTTYGGAKDNGTLFALSGDGTMTILHTFSDDDAIGYNARGGFARAHGYLYGATGGIPNTIFRIQKLKPAQ